MAYQLLNWVMAQTDISGSATCVLMVLVIRADKVTYECFPSLKSLAQDSHFSRRTVTTCLRELEDKKKIRREQRPLPQSTVYRILAPADSANSALVQDLPYPDSAKFALDSAKFALPIVRNLPTNKSIEPVIKGKKSVRHRPTKVSEEFSINESMREWASREGFDPDTVERETAAMIDHFRGSGKPKLDWIAVWRNWLRNSRRFNSNGNGQRQTNGDITNQNALNFLRRIDQQDCTRDEREAQRGNNRRLHGEIELPFDGADGSGDKQDD